MLECDGYKMFHGSAKVTPVNGKPYFYLTGTWLFKPEWETGEKDGCWYCKPDNDGFAQSYPPDILSNFCECEDV